MIVNPSSSQVPLPVIFFVFLVVLAFWRLTEVNHKEREEQETVLAQQNFIKKQEETIEYLQRNYLQSQTDRVDGLNEVDALVQRLKNQEKIASNLANEVKKLKSQLELCRNSSSHT